MLNKINISKGKINEDLTLQYADRPTANSPIVQIDYGDDSILYSLGFKFQENEEINLSELISGIETAKRIIQDRIEGASDLTSFDFQREIELLKKLTAFAKQSKEDNNNVVMLRANMNHPNQEWIDTEDSIMNDYHDFQDNQEDFDSYKQYGLSENDNENTKFKIGDSIENSGNDGEFFDMNSDSEQYVEFPSELSGEIVDIKNGFYILKGEYKGEPIGMVKVKISDPYYRKKRIIDNKGNVYVETYNELMRELRRNYDSNNISYTGVEGDSMYFWLEPSETMIGQFNKDENKIWFKPSR